MRMASSKPGPKMARFFTSVAPPLPFNPPARSVSSGSPAWGTSFISIQRCVPTSTTSLPLPLDNHSRAMAMAGKTWPPVPPPAIKSFTCLCFFRLLADVQEHAGSQQHHQQTRAAIADEREWNAFGRHHAEHHHEVDERLAEDHCRDAQREQPAKPIGGGKRCAQSAPRINPEKGNHQNGADESQLFADHCVDEIGVRFRKIKELLFTLHQANAGEATRTY